MRLPARHDAPLTPLEMNEEDVLNFHIAIASGFGGQAAWRRDCACEHPAREHHQAVGRCRRCTCSLFRRSEHSERLDIWLHPDAINYLPDGVKVIAYGNRYDGDLIQFRLARDLDSGIVEVRRGGVKKETTIWTSPPVEGLGEE